MKRLTERKDGEVMLTLPDDFNERLVEAQIKKAMERLADYEDSGLTPNICAEYKKFDYEAVGKGVPFKRIIELMEAEREGRLLLLPVKEGTKVFQVKLRYSGNAIIETYFYLCYMRPEDFGKTVFLTREEAEKASAKLYL